jgi:hypothetical protein
MTGQPTSAHGVGEGADQRVVDRVPEDGDQGGDGSQARFQPDHIGEEDGIEGLPQGTLAGFTPAAGPISQFDPERQEPVQVSLFPADIFLLNQSQV